jgi:hypothetical protein
MVPYKLEDLAETLTCAEVPRHIVSKSVQIASIGVRSGLPAHDGVRDGWAAVEAKGACLPFPFPSAPTPGEDTGLLSSNDNAVTEAPAKLVPA